METYDEIVDSVRDRFSDESDDNPIHRKLLSLIRRLKKEGEDALGGHLEKMKKADRMYHAYRVPDDQDKKAAEKGEPIKIIYPVTYAQIETALAVLSGIFDKNPFYELEGSQPQYSKNSKLMELDVEYQLDQAAWTLKRYLWMKDPLKYGFGMLWVDFIQEMSYITANRPVPILGSLFGLTQEVTEPVVGYEGVGFDLSDPYTVNFDPSVSIGDIQKGQYVFRTYKKSYNELMLLQDSGEFFNIEGLPRNQQSLHSRESQREGRAEDIRAGLTNQPAVKGGDMVVLDMCYVKLVPKDYQLSTLGRMQIWEITMANNARIVQARPSKYEHGKFPCAILEYCPDEHELVNEGMAQVIDGLQDHINWLLNTHMNSVRKVINDQLIVDPDAVNMEDIKKRNPIIRLQPHAKAGVDRYIKQLAVVDVTQTHVADAMRNFEAIQRTTGVNDGVMGKELPSARTATEVQSVNKFSTGRIGLIAKLMWDQGYRPAGRQIIQNTQQSVSTERFYKVTAGLAQVLGLPPEAVTNGIGVAPEDLQGFFNIKMIDATTPSDRMAVASHLKELLIATMQAPQLVPMLGINVQQLLVQMLLGFNVKNVSDFIMPTGAIDPQMLAVASNTNGNGTRGVEAQVRPNEHVADQVQKGNIVPIPGGGRGQN